MLKYILAGGIPYWFALAVHAQMKSPTLYKDEIFTAVTVQKDLSYFTKPHDSDPHRGKNGRSNLFDWYEPKGDSAALRPLIIWMHGGGFKFGSKEEVAIRLWSAGFARRGYVCAAINYRLSKKFERFDFDGLVRGCYAAIQDARLAIAYFRHNAGRLRIDTNRIVLAGNSAGGILALQIAFSNDTELMQLIGSPGIGSPEPGGPIARIGGRAREPGLDGRAPEPGHIAAVVNFWGGIFQTSWLKTVRVPIVSVHGRKDRIVPIDRKGFPLYGSLAIHRAADSLFIPNRLKIYDDYAHQLQKHFFPLFAGRGVKRRWEEAGQFVADFLYEMLFEGVR
jgi:acetyl esterase/lipase